MSTTKQLLSSFIAHEKYARHIDEENRRETWEELVTRNMDMHVKKYPALTNEIADVYSEFVLTKKVLPSMRSLQFGGRAIEVNNSRINNCSAVSINNRRAFREVMFLLLSGVGVGIGVRAHEVNMLPPITKPSTSKKYLVDDSIEGWANAVDVLCKAYFTGCFYPVFDFSAIRPKGTQLHISGGKAPGHEPLKAALERIDKIFMAKANKGRLLPIDCYDISCHIADAVLAGGIRRAALITLFDFYDLSMLHAKRGEWWIENPQRARSNNSVTLTRWVVTKKQFYAVMKAVEASGAGEPGILWVNDDEELANPCVEIFLKSGQFCNLVEINGDGCDDAELLKRAKAAAFIATLQSGYTNFHYLRSLWKKTTETDALIGVGITGLAGCKATADGFKKAANAVLEVNAEIANLIWINPSPRCCTVKPSGTSSLVLGTSSGIHPYHAPYYVRRIQLKKADNMYKYLLAKAPFMVHDFAYSPVDTAVVEFPIAATGSTRNDMTTEKMLERVAFVNRNWVRAGTRIKGSKQHNNVSCTVSVRPNEWELVSEWMWRNKGKYNGISLLPYDGGTYKDAPFEEITEQQYCAMSERIEQAGLDFSQVTEFSDETNFGDIVACAGGMCEI